MYMYMQYMYTQALLRFPNELVTRMPTYKHITYHTMPFVLEVPLHTVYLVHVHRYEWDNYNMYIKLL